MTSATRERSTSSPDQPGWPAPDAPLFWSVDGQDDDLFVYVYLGNVARVGLFVPTCDPYPVGTNLDLTLLSHEDGSLHLRGGVQWINPWRSDGANLNPGMGVLLTGLDTDLRERLVEAVRTLVFLR